MSLQDLQHEGMLEMKRLFADYRLKGEDEEPVGFNFFEETAPILESDEEPSFIPYIVSRISGGKIPEVGEMPTAELYLIIATFDNDPKAAPNKDILAVIQRIIERFSKNACLGNKYTKTGQMEFSVSDEDTYPYAFGGIKINFMMPQIVPEDDYC